MKMENESIRQKVRLLRKVVIIRFEEESTKPKENHYLLGTMKKTFNVMGGVACTGKYMGKQQNVDISFTFFLDDRDKEGNFVIIYKISPRIVAENNENSNYVEKPETSEQNEDGMFQMIFYYQKAGENV